jgi:hypothetical protein
MGRVASLWVLIDFEAGFRSDYQLGKQEVDENMS